MYCLRRRAFKNELIIVPASALKADMVYNTVQSFRGAGYDHIVLFGYKKQ